MKSSSIEPREAFADAEVESGLPSVARWRVPPTLPYFDGHFPAMPILPAVAMIDAAVWFVEKATGVRWRLGEVVQAKFARPVGPGDDVRIELGTDDGDGRIAVRWSLAGTAERLAEWTMRLERELTEGPPQAFEGPKRSTIA